MIEVHSDCRNLSGGDKQKWLRMHREEVLDYYHKYGPDACLQRFNMRQYTLEAFLIPRQINYQGMTIADRALYKAEQACESYREIRHRLNDMETQLEEIVPMTQIAYGFLAAVAQVMPAIELQQAKEKADSFNLSDLGGKSGW